MEVAVPGGEHQVSVGHVVRRMPRLPITQHPTSFRLQVNLPYNQRQVLRVSPRTTLGQVHQDILQHQHHLVPDSARLVHPHRPHSPLDLEQTLEAYGCAEITLLAQGLQETSRNNSFSAPKVEEEKKKSKGILRIFSRKKKEVSLPPLAPSRSENSLLPKRPSTLKRKPAPAPPPQSTTTTQSSLSQSTQSLPESEGSHHSRHSSDSSGYHEPSVLSDCSSSTTVAPPKSPEDTSMESKSRAKRRAPQPPPLPVPPPALGEAPQRQRSIPREESEALSYLEHVLQESEDSESDSLKDEVVSVCQAEVHAHQDGTGATLDGGLSEHGDHEPEEDTSSPGSTEASSLESTPRVIDENHQDSLSEELSYGCVEAPPLFRDTATESHGSSLSEEINNVNSLRSISRTDSTASSSLSTDSPRAIPKLPNFAMGCYPTSADQDRISSEQSLQSRMNDLLNQPGEITGRSASLLDLSKPHRLPAQSDQNLAAEYRRLQRQFASWQRQLDSNHSLLRHENISPEPPESSFKTRSLPRPHKKPLSPVDIDIESSRILETESQQPKRPETLIEPLRNLNQEHKVTQAPSPQDKVTQMPSPHEKVTAASQAQVSQETFSAQVPSPEMVSQTESSSTQAPSPETVVQKDNSGTQVPSPETVLINTGTLSHYETVLNTLSTQAPSPETVLSSTLGTQAPSPETVLNNTSGTQAPSPETVLSNTSGTQAPSPETVLNHTSGTQIPSPETEIRKETFGTQVPSPETVNHKDATNSNQEPETNCSETRTFSNSSSQISKEMSCNQTCSPVKTSNMNNKPNSSPSSCLSAAGVSSNPVSTPKSISFQTNLTTSDSSLSSNASNQASGTRNIQLQNNIKEVPARDQSSPQQMFSTKYIRQNINVGSPSKEAPEAPSSPQEIALTTSRSQTLPRPRPAASTTDASSTMTLSRRPVSVTIGSWHQRQKSEDIVSQESSRVVASARSKFISLESIPQQHEKRKLPPVPPVKTVQNENYQQPKVTIKSTLKRNSESFINTLPEEDATSVASSVKRFDSTSTIPKTLASETDASKSARSTVKIPPQEPAAKSVTKRQGSVTAIKTLESNDTHAPESSATKRHASVTGIKTLEPSDTHLQEPFAKSATKKHSETKDTHKNVPQETSASKRHASGDSIKTLEPTDPHQTIPKSSASTSDVRPTATFRVSKPLVKVGSMKDSAPSIIGLRKWPLETTGGGALLGDLRAGSKRPGGAQEVIRRAEVDLRKPAKTVEKASQPKASEETTLVKTTLPKTVQRSITMPHSLHAAAGPPLMPPIPPAEPIPVSSRLLSRTLPRQTSSQAKPNADPRDQLMLEIRGFGGKTALRKIPSAGTGFHLKVFGTSSTAK